MARQKKLTGLWLNKTENGETYMSGKTKDGQRFTIWKNKFFDEDKAEGKSPAQYNLFIDINN